LTPDPPLIDEQRSFYDSLWRDVGAASLNRHERARLGAMARMLAEYGTADAEMRILEVGCGRGWLSGLLLRRFGNVVAVDLSPHAIEKAREQFPDVTFIAQDIFAESLPQQNDLVVSSEVLEHVEDQRSFAELLAGALKPGGLLLLTTPNGRWKQRWLARPDVRPQPIENWLHPTELAQLIGQPCDVLEQATLFVPWQDGSRAGRTMTRLDRRLGGLGPAAITARLGGGLYSVILGRKPLTDN